MPDSISVRMIRLPVGGMLLLCALLVAGLAGRGAAKTPTRGVRPAGMVARQLLSNRLLDSANKVVDAALLTDSLNLDLRMIKAEILGKQRRRSEQIAVLRSVLVGRPEYPAANLRLAHIFCDSGLVDSAAKYLIVPAQEDTLNPEVSYLLGRVDEKRGELDVAAGMYRRCEGILERGELARIPLGPDDRLTPFSLKTLEGKPFRWAGGQPAIFLFWATWSGGSIDALKSIVAQLPQAGISWQFVPVNIDDRLWRKTPRPRVAAKLQDAGYKGPVLVDSGLALFEHLGILQIPTLVATNLAGDIAVVERGWSSAIKAHIIHALMAGLGDSLPRPPPAKTDTACARSRRLLSLARSFWDAGDPFGAWNQARTAASRCGVNAFPHIQIASWYWQWGDTLHSREQVAQSVRADSLNPWAWYSVARLDRFTGAREPATVALRRALSLDSNFTPAWGEIGRLAILAGDTVTIRKSTDTITRLNRHAADLAVLQAALLGARGLHQDAVVVWRRILDDRFP